MEKTAAKPGHQGFLNKLREKTNISGIAAEKFFNPEFQKVMESLREKDDQIRSLVSGDAIGDADPGNDPVSMKDLLSSSKSNINRREYMSAVAELGRFHKKLFDIVQFISKLSFDVDKVHHEFLFRDLGDDHKKQLEDLKSRWASVQQANFVKEASIMDFFMNIGTKRGRALAAWEKRYPKQIGKLKKDTAMLQSKSEALSTHVLSALKEMATARATRNVDNYMKAADKITKAYLNYDKIFKEYYASNVKGFLEKVELITPTEKVTDSKELGKMEIPDLSGPGSSSKPSVPELDQPHSAFPLVEKEPFPLVKRIEPDPFPSESKAPPTNPGPPPSGMESSPPSIPSAPKMPNIPSGTIPYGKPMRTVPYEKLISPVEPVKSKPTPTVPYEMPRVPDTIPEFKSDQVANDLWGGKSAHKKFLNSLETLSGESPILLAAHIKRYARSIQVTDLETSIKLFKIANSIKG